MSIELHILGGGGGVNSRREHVIEAGCRFTELPPYVPVWGKQTAAEERDLQQIYLNLFLS